MIPVTKPFLPPENEYNSIVSEIWKTQWLTNNGPLVQKLEKKISALLGLKKTLFVNNGTSALILAIKSLELEGEIITTPFSFVATTSSIVWGNCKPIFVDIESKTLNIDVNKIQQAITNKTCAIIATHVYGNPCNVEAIEVIAKKNNLKVIYDGAHAFGIRLGGKSIFKYGDISICSTHATKLFHTTEGGLIFTKNEDLLTKLESMRNFGFESNISFSNLGTNAKNSEFHAAMGLVNINYYKIILEKRKLLTELYDHLLLNKNLLLKSALNKNIKNYSYYPILFASEEILIKCKLALESQHIFTRRYFFPSLTNSLPYIKNQQNLPIANDLSKRVLCLPLYFDLNTKDVQLICQIIISNIG